MYHVNTQGVDECMIKVHYYSVLNIHIIPIIWESGHTFYEKAVLS